MAPILLYPFRIGRTAGRFIPAIVLWLIFCPVEAPAEFYRYVDKNGVTHFVDSKAGIPKEYRKDLSTVEERYDHLSDEDRARRIEEDRKRSEALREKREKELNGLREKERMVAEAARLEQEEKEKENQLEKERAANEAFMKNFETKIVIRGIHALVPCTLGYKGKEAETYLLLDTGCTVTALHQDVAKTLRLKGERNMKTKVANGDIINTKIARLDYIRIGPYKVDDFYVGIIPYKGPDSGDHGLLGMNFLAGRDYKIDYVRGVIKWMP